MGPRQQALRRAFKVTFALLVIVLCVLPFLYFEVYRFADYVVCRSMVSAKLGMGLSPISIEGYVEKSITPGMSRDAAISKLSALGRIQVVPQAGGRDVFSDEVILRYCSHPLNAITMFINYSSAGEIDSIRILGD